MRILHIQDEKELPARHKKIPNAHTVIVPMDETPGVPPGQTPIVEDYLAAGYEVIANSEEIGMRGHVRMALPLEKWKKEQEARHTKNDAYKSEVGEVKPQKAEGAGTKDKPEVRVIKKIETKVVPLEQAIADAKNVDEHGLLSTTEGTTEGTT